MPEAFTRTCAASMRAHRLHRAGERLREAQDEIDQGTGSIWRAHALRAICDRDARAALSNWEPEHGH